MKKIIVAAIFSILLVLISFSCNNKTFEFPQPDKNSKNESYIFLSDIFKIGEKEYKADYGSLTVPENRSKNNSRLIHLPVIRIHSKSKNPKEPIFAFAGGPGQTNLNWSPIDSLLYDHDFVMVGYRGVDGSSVLDCPEVTEAMINCGDDLLSEKSRKYLSKSWKKSINRLKSIGIDLDGYTIPETVEDMEVMRKIFNYERINIISESYGTRIAYIYGIMHPSSIYRTVMIGVNTPGNFIWAAKQTDELIKYYSGLWAEDDEKSKLGINLAGSMKKVLNNMPKKWLFFSINPGKVKAATFGLLMHRNTSALVFDAYIAAENGDFSGLALMSLAFDYTFPKMMVYGDLLVKAASADLAYAKNIKYNNDHNIILGAPLNEIIWEPFIFSGIDIKMIPENLKTFNETNVETLMLSGSLDFANPPKFATEFLKYFKNGKQIILSEFGHVGDLRYLNQSMSDKIITQFFSKGKIESSLVKYVPMDFNVSFGFNDIAKLSLGIIVIIILFLLGFIYLIYRKIVNFRKNKQILKIL
ncbi:MAG: alpha/beta hydrolase [Ignavibacteriae bacterium]|nr:alpha/beta hydrolase [Ignavibacteriota bacterium]